MEAIAYFNLDVLANLATKLKEALNLVYMDSMKSAGSGFVFPSALKFTDS